MPRVAGRGVVTGRRGREPVIRVGPGRRQVRVQSRAGYPLGELGELMTASLSHRCERDRVPGQAERYLEWLAGTITARHGCHGQHGAIDAT